MLNLISLDEVKTQLGLAEATYNAAITAMIPIVSSDVRRILNTSYDKFVLAVFESGSTDIDFGIANQLYDGMYGAYTFELGQVVYHENLPEDTYLSALNPVSGVYTLSNAATGDGTYIMPTVKISMWPTIAKMIWYKIQKQSTSAAMEKATKSISYGAVSKSYSDAEINQKWNYPNNLIEDLGVPYASVG